MPLKSRNRGEDTLRKARGDRWRGRHIRGSGTHRRRDGGGCWSRRHIRRVCRWGCRWRRIVKYIGDSTGEAVVELAVGRGRDLDWKGKKHGLAEEVMVVGILILTE
ncbi:unnamed protein product [Linum trigynum]|uniref:Uncharacterized protein n=1 Tax=Linum trigynum TaxID=586398 RepID=A0AAV2EQM7_9ROSI